MWNADTQTFCPWRWLLTCVVDTIRRAGLISAPQAPVTTFKSAGWEWALEPDDRRWRFWRTTILKASRARRICDLVVAQIKETAAWAVGGRVGLAFGPNLFTYINGGSTARASAVLSFASSVGGPVGLTSRRSGRPAGFSAAAPKRRWLPCCRSACSCAASIGSPASIRQTFPSLVPAARQSDDVGVHPGCRRSARRLVYRFNWH